MLPIPEKPVKLALIGAGHRSQTIYSYLFEDLKPWIELTCVVDPVREHADALAVQLGVKAIYDVHDLVASNLCEAAVVVVPIPLHYAYSVYLSQNGIHNLIETTWCSTLTQARAWWTPRITGMRRLPTRSTSARAGFPGASGPTCGRTIRRSLRGRLKST